jgi:hypothetical protein
MARLYADNINTKLAASISDTDTTITVVDATGMPSPTGGDFALVTLTQGATVEKVLLTARSGTTLTVTRGAEGSTPANFTTANVIIAATASSFDAPGSTGQVIVNDGGVLTGDAGLTYNTSTNVLTNTDGQVVLTGGTRTTSAPLIDATQTWDGSGQTFTGLRVNVTDTASAIASSLLTLQRSGSTIVSVRKSGAVEIAVDYTAIADTVGPLRIVSTTTAGGARALGFDSLGGLDLGANQKIRFGGQIIVDANISGGASGFRNAGADYSFISNNASVELRRNTVLIGVTNPTALEYEATDTLGQRRGTNAQTFRLYNTWSSAGANFERTRLSWASNVFLFGTEKAGTGVARPMELQTDGTTALTLTTAQKAEFAQTIKTAAPTGGTAAEWKLGTVASVSPTSPDRTIEVEIGGTTYYLAAKTTND